MPFSSGWRGRSKGNGEGREATESKATGVCNVNASADGNSGAHAVGYAQEPGFLPAAYLLPQELQTGWR